MQPRSEHVLDKRQQSSKMQTHWRGAAPLARNRHRLFSPENPHPIINVVEPRVRPEIARRDHWDDIAVVDDPPAAACGCMLVVQLRDQIGETCAADARAPKGVLVAHGECHFSARSRLGIDQELRGAEGRVRPAERVPCDVQSWWGI